MLLNRIAINTGFAIQSRHTYTFELSEYKIKFKNSDKGTGVDSCFTRVQCVLRWTVLLFIMFCYLKQKMQEFPVHKDTRSSTVNSSCSEILHYLLRIGLQKILRITALNILKRFTKFAFAYLRFVNRNYSSVSWTYLDVP